MSDEIAEDAGGQAAGEVEPAGVPATPGCHAVYSGQVGPYLDELSARVARLEEAARPKPPELDEHQGDNGGQ